MKNFRIRLQLSKHFNRLRQLISGMKKILVATLAIFGIVTVAYLIINEKIPTGEANPQAEALADKMLNAVNIQGWDTLTAIKWTFRNSHHFIWDKKRNLVSARWDETHVLFNPETKEGRVWQLGNEIKSEKAKKSLLYSAWSYFTNDSFWLCAPFKVRDLGTERRLVKTDEGDALLVSYTSGGVTPGDSYLWILDENGLPKAWKMWVSIIPIGGLQFTWEDWKSYENNVLLSTRHKGLMTVEITSVKTAQNVEELSDGSDPFTEMY